MGEGRSESPGVLEIHAKGRRFREAVQVFKGCRVSRDVPFARRSEEWDLVEICT